MPSFKTKRIQHREDFRREILDVASAAFLSKGYERLSMRTLAAELGCAPGTIYLYFRNKQELLHAVVEDSLNELLRRMRAVPEDEDLANWLKAKLRAYIDFGLRTPNHYKCAFLLQPERHGGRRYKPHPSFGDLIAAVTKCAEAGLVAPDEVAIVSQVLWASIHGLTSLLISRPNFPWAQRDTLINRLIETTIAGALRPDFAQRRGERGW